MYTADFGNMEHLYLAIQMINDHGVFLGYY